MKERRSAPGPGRAAPTPPSAPATVLRMRSPPSTAAMTSPSADRSVITAWFYRTQVAILRAVIASTASGSARASPRATIPRPAANSTITAKSARHLRLRLNRAIDPDEVAEYGAGGRILADLDSRLPRSTTTCSSPPARGDRRHAAHERVQARPRRDRLQLALGRRAGTSWSPPTRAPRRSPTPPTRSPPSTASGSTTRSRPAARSATTTRSSGSPRAARGSRSSATSASSGRTRRATSSPSSGSAWTTRPPAASSSPTSSTTRPASTAPTMRST